jgi:HEAT repeat protein
MKSKSHLRLIVIFSLISIVGLSGCDRFISKLQPKSELTQATEQLQEYATFGSNVYDHDLAKRFAAIGQPAIDQLIPLLQDKNRKVRQQAAFILGEMRATSAVPALMAALSAQGEDDYVAARDIVEALGKMGSAAQPAVDRLIAQNDSYRLSQMGEVAVPSLIKLFKDPRSDRQLLAINALGEMGSVAKPAAPQFIAALKHPDSAVKVQAAWALVNIQTAPNQALPILMAALQNPDESIRSIAITTLGAMGNDAKSAVPKLLNLLQPARPTGGTWEQTKAAEALAHIGAFPELITALNSPDALVRWRVAYALGGIQEAAAPTVPSLIKALKDPDANVRSNTVRALEKIGKSAQPAISELETVARQDPDNWVRSYAARALQELSAK